MKMLENFIRKVANYKEVYALEDRIQTSIKMIQDKVGNKKSIRNLVCVVHDLHADARQCEQQDL